MAYRPLAVLLLGFPIIGLTACGTLGNFNSTDHEFDLAKRQSQWVDASERGVYVGVNAEVNKKAPGGVFICPEPSPDAVSSYNAALSAAVQTQAGVSGSVSASDAETAASIGLRTVGIEALRDWNTSLCIREMNGRIDRWRADLDFNRQQRYMIGLLAIDELANAAASAAKAPATANAPAAADVPAAKKGTQSDTPADAPAAKGGGTTPAVKTSQIAPRSRSADPNIISAGYLLVAAGDPGTAAPAASGTAAPAAPAAKPAAKKKADAAPSVAGNSPGSGQTPQNSQAGADTPGKSQAGGDTGIAHVADVVADITKSMLTEDYTLSVCSTFFADSIADNPGFLEANKTNPTVLYCQSVMQDGRDYEALRSKLWTAYTANCLDAATFDSHKDFCAAIPSPFTVAAIQQPGAAVMPSGGSGTASLAGPQERLLSETVSPSTALGRALESLQQQKPAKQ